MLALCACAQGIMSDCSSSEGVLHMRAHVDGGRYETSMSLVLPADAGAACCMCVLL